MSHDCCAPNKKNTTKNRKLDPFMIIIIFSTISLLVIAVIFGSKVGSAANVKSDSQTAVEIENNKYDFGNVDFGGGVVDKSFSIKNTGSSTLKIYNVKTSCMCTTAQLKTSEFASKKFGMHEASNEVIEVKPGNTADLKVEFDPAYHGPSGLGSISRTVTMETNDPVHKKLEFYLTANVVKN